MHVLLTVSPLRVLGKVTFALARIITFITCESRYCLVHSLVLGQVAFRGKLLATRAAHEGFVSRVLTGMNNQISIRPSHPFTFLTLDRTLVGVCQ